MSKSWLFATAVFLPIALAAQLKQETVKDWDEYVHAANARMEERLRGAEFLWAAETRERLARVQGGEIVVAPVAEHMPVRVASGLIHDWIGAAFIPNVKLDDVLAVVRNYEHYREFYQPSVVDAKLLKQGGENDRFAVTLLNKSLFLKTALEGEYETRYVHVDGKHCYSVSSTTRMQEIRDFGQSNERKLPDGEGSGYIWRLHSFTRFVERDGGVYVEVEAIALSRTIPAALHPVVDPIVRRVSRNSLLISLRQTQDAARNHHEHDVPTVATLKGR